jgi:alpha-beta hydrolase superfamily lysophospholipase
MLTSEKAAETGACRDTKSDVAAKAQCSTTQCSTTQCSTWVEHFPGNVRWTNAMQIVKGMAPWAAVALAEVDLVGERLKARQREANPDQVWRQEWEALADRVAAVADSAASDGRQITAGNHYMRAGNYYYSAERFVPPGEEKLALYRKALRCYHAALARLYPQVERVDVAYEGQALAAYFMKAQNVRGPAPTVVLFDGMDNCKEMSVIFAGVEFAKRGIHTLAIDGPGQGETQRLRRIHSRPDFEVAGSAAYDYVASRAEVDDGRIVVMGYSFGGYHAPRIAAFEHRYAGCVALGAMHWDLHGWQAEIKAKNAADPKTSTSSNFQFRWILGAPDNDTALEWAKRFTLEDVAEKITCPFLVVHGENDRIVPVKEAQTLFDRVGSRHKTIKIFTSEEGGAEHCQVDHRQLGIDYVGDWILANV